MKDTMWREHLLMEKLGCRYCKKSFRTCDLSCIRNPDGLNIFFLYSLFYWIENRNYKTIGRIEK